MRTSSVADQIARRGHWQDALTLLQAAAGRMGSSDRDSRLVPGAGAWEPPEAVYRRARKALALRTRAWLADSLAESLATWRMLKLRAGLVLALLATMLLAAWAWRTLRESDLTPGATWRASSASQGASSGTFIGRRIHDSLPNLFVHTREESDPFVDVDLLSTRSIRRVVVTNRHDCCYERARGLVLSTSLDGEHFVAVAARDKQSIFRRWEVELPSVPARYLRLQLPGERRVLHLADVRAYGR